MKKFNRYKVNCSELPELMSREQGNNPPTEKDLEEFLRILEKDSIDITEPQKNKLQQFVTKMLTYDNYSLSTTARKAIYKHYAYSQYGAGKITTGNKVAIQLEKGEIAEPEAIKLLSKLDGVEYQKNEKLYSNKWFKGIPDILLMENDKYLAVKDVKVCLDLPSFLERVDGDSVREDRWEMLAYLDVFGLKEGEICYCLVNMPDRVKEIRLNDHKVRMELLGYSPDHIRKRLKQIEKSMMYDYIPEENRVRRFNITRKSHFTKQARNRVLLVRQKLQKLHGKFENRLILPESNDISEQEATS